MRWLSIKLYFIFFSFHCAAPRVANEIVLFDKKTTICICDAENKFQNEALHFSKQLDQLLKSKTCIQTTCKSKDFQIKLELIKTDEYAYKIFADQENLNFQAVSSKDMARAINYFLIHELGYIPYSHKKSQLNFQERKIAYDYAVIGNAPTFEYTEPYFIENYREDFRQIHNTNVLDETWALWGHNISKHIKLTPKMFAQVNGNTSENQLCFSSKELHIAISQFIKKSQNDNPEVSKFMIMPNDNLEVCTCESCEKLGNSNENASPAVFDLINKLAKQFPKLSFYGSAYHTTKTPPKFELLGNVGVMFSMIDLPKGVPMKDSKWFKPFYASVSSWRQKTQNLYLWEYVIHFDNYLNTFPTINSTSLNLKLFSDLGFKGVFLHGTEEMYAAFSDLKAFVYAELLSNPDYQIKNLVRTYFNNFYPKTAELLSNYYLTCEFRLLNTPIDIYGGWRRHIATYLIATELNILIEKLKSIYPSCSTEEKDNLNPILAALIYQKLEISRIKGIHEFGLLEYKSDNNQWIVRETVKNDFKDWITYSQQAKFKHLNEVRLPVELYNEHWKKTLLEQQITSLIFGAKPISLNNLVEDYSDLSMLTDGAVGFVDYYNNWFIAYQENIHVKIPINSKFSGKATLNIRFLNQPRHRIFIPEKIQVKFDNEIHTWDVHSNGNFENDNIFIFSHEVQLNSEDFLEITLVKQDKYTKFGNAMDEVQLIPMK